ncbi:exosome complex component 10-like [Ptychodera flava]|uniref:exosome complex component 10-like n=1 Tax=Ptychodera flava TaxID=63121 RepID=UPI00396A5314
MAEERNKHESTTGQDQSGSSESEPLFGDYSDVNSYAQKALGTFLQATKCSNSLPAAGDDYEYYSSFDSIRDFYHDNSRRLLDNITDIIRHQGIRGSIREGSKAVEIEDKMDVITEANDIILERVGTMLDEASGINKNSKPVLPPGARGNIVISSWNRKTHDRSKSETFRLLHAKNIQRPQLKFKEKVDNSNMPFIPLLKSKPNAKKPLERVESSEDTAIPAALSNFLHQQRQEQESGSSFDITAHPYQYELDHFQPSPSQLESSEPQMYKSLEDTPLKIITSFDQLQELSDLLNKQTEFAVDLEAHTYRSFQGFTCLMQLSTRDEDFLVDTIELRSDLHILNESFTNLDIVKVFHGADSDIGWLQRDFGIYVVNLFDTGQASRVLSFAHYSLAHLMNHYCGVQANKQYQLADWRIRPLPEELVKYAREDTHYLLYIYDKMRNELIEKGNAQKNLLRSVIERSTMVCLKKYQKPLFTENSHEYLYKKNRKSFNSQQMHAFKRLYAWRDRIARQEDESTGYVLPNHMMFQIAEILPKEAQGILACCNPIPPLVRQHMNELHQFIMMARNKPLQKRVETPQKEEEDRKVKDVRKESYLNCPHDLSHLSAARSVEMTDAAPMSSHSALFGDNDDDIRPPAVCVAEPIISIFGYPSDDRQAASRNTAQKKVERIKALFVSPFEKYLPDSKLKQISVSLLEANKITLQNPSQVGTNTSTEHISEATDMWKLKPPTLPKEKIEVQPVNQLQSQKRSRDEQTEDSAISIREQKRQKTDSSEKGEQEAEHNKEIAKDKSEKESGKKPAERKDERPFHPFDYSKVNYKVFQEDEKKKKKKKCNPHSQIGGPSFQNAPKSRTAPSSGARSMTSGHKAGSHHKKQHWPKR